MAHWLSMRYGISHWKALRWIAVNRNPAVRCALVIEPVSARLARDHNDANILALGARVVGPELAKGCIEAFLATPFGGGRHARRVEKLSKTPQDA